MEVTAFNVIVTVYLVIAFAKFLLALSSVSAAIGVMSRLSGMERGKVKMEYVFYLPFTLAVMCLIFWIPTLFREGFKFFFIYSKFVTMRDCVRARRSINSEQ